MAVTQEGLSSLENLYAKAYSGSIDLGLQQKNSRLGATIQVEAQVPKMAFYDRIETTEGQEDNIRGGDTPHNTVGTTRRMVTARHYEWGHLLEDRDKMNMLADPQSATVQAALAWFNRNKDQKIIDAFEATSYGGEDGDQTVAFDTSNQSIAVDYQEGGSGSNSGLTLGKLRQAKKLFALQEVGLDDNSTDNNNGLIKCLVSPEQIQNLLADSTATSQDYAAVKALVNGEFNTFMGFQFIQTNQLPKSGNNRTCYFYTPDSMLMGRNPNPQISIAPNPQKKFKIQIYIKASFGVTRMYEEKVIRCYCLED